MPYCLYHLSGVVGLWKEQDLGHAKTRKRKSPFT
jgi:hypothetical protein